jgi:hypothetical protein
MNKILFVLFAFFAAGITASCNKDNSVKPATVRTQIYSADKSDVGSGD